MSGDPERKGLYGITSVSGLEATRLQIPSGSHIISFVEMGMFQVCLFNRLVYPVDAVGGTAEAPALRGCFAARNAWPPEATQTDSYSIVSGPSRFAAGIPAATAATTLLP